MDNMSDTQETNDGCSGCSGMFLWLVALPILLVVVLAIVGLVFFDDDEPDETIVIAGVVEVSGACSMGRTLSIDGTRITLDNGDRISGLTCEYTFAKTMPVRDKYTFRLEGESPITLRRSMIDTIGPDGDTELRVRLSW